MSAIRPPLAIPGLVLALLTACSGGETVLGNRDGEGEADAESPDDVAEASDDGEEEAEACVPNCDGRECGDDGCGSPCPPGCTTDQFCREPAGICDARPAWVQVLPSSPPLGLLGSMTYDATREVFVFFAGPRYVEERGLRLGYTAGGTWEFDGTSWTQIPTAAAPGSWEGSGVLVYDASRRVVVLFGGRDWDNTPLGDTWEYNGRTWSRASPRRSPPARAEHAMAFDSVRGVTVLFGGKDDAMLLDDTWEYDGTTWIETTPASSPAGRFAHAMAYDSSRAVVVLFGGGNDVPESYLDDTWEYDGSSWVLRYRYPDSVPPGRRYSAMTFDSARGVSLLVGGWRGDPGYLADTWEYDGTWSEIPVPAPRPASRWRAGLAFDSARGYTILFGGYGSDSSGEYHSLADTWRFDGANWSEVSAGTAWPLTGGPALAYDSRRERLVLFGGSQPGGMESLSVVDGTLEFDGHSWLLPSTESSPPARWGDGMTFDSARGVVVLFGIGISGMYPGCLAQTWEYDGTTWTDATPSASPSVCGLTAYDATRGVTVLLGTEIYSTVFETWEYDGRAWIALTPSTSPRAWGPAMAFDSTRGVVVLWSGESCSSPPCEEMAGFLWEYDGVDWTEVGTAPKFRDPELAGMAYDEGRRTLVFFAGGSPITREFDGARWRDVTTATAPSIGGPLAYDTARGTVILVNGNETWEYYGP